MSKHDKFELATKVMLDNEYERVHNPVMLKYARRDLRVTNSKNLRLFKRLDQIEDNYVFVAVYSVLGDGDMFVAYAITRDPIFFGLRNVFNSRHRTFTESSLVTTLINVRHRDYDKECVIHRKRFPNGTARAWARAIFRYFMK